MNILLRWILNAVAIIAAAYIVPGTFISGFSTALLVALVLGLLNVFIKPILIIFTLPITILTLGLFMFVINTFLILLTSRIVSGFFISDFWHGLLFSLVFSIIASIFSALEQRIENK